MTKPLSNVRHETRYYSWASILTLNWNHHHNCNIFRPISSPHCPAQSMYAHSSFLIIFFKEFFITLLLWVIFQRGPPIGDRKSLNFSAIRRNRTSDSCWPALVESKFAVKMRKFRRMSYWNAFSIKNLAASISIEWKDRKTDECLTQFLNVFERQRANLLNHLRS